MISSDNMCARIKETSIMKETHTCTPKSTNPIEYPPIVFTFPMIGLLYIIMNNYYRKIYLFPGYAWAQPTSPPQSEG